MGDGKVQIVAGTSSIGLLVMAHNQRMYRLFRVKSTLPISIAGCDLKDLVKGSDHGGTVIRYFRVNTGRKATSLWKKKININVTPTN